RTSLRIYWRRLARIAFAPTQPAESAKKLVTHSSDAVGSRIMANTACPSPSAETVNGRADLAEKLAAVRRRIRIGEDNELSRRQLTQLLQQEPALDVQTAADGTPALHELAEFPYSIVITDLRMPHLDGMELIQEVQNRQLPVTVIVTTGHGSIDE